MPDETKAPSPTLLEKHAQALEALPISLTVTVNTPCEGSQTVDRPLGSNAYVGTVGDFNAVILYPVEYNNELTWELKIWDYDTSSQCYGVTTWRRTEPGSSPVFSYCLLMSTGPDCDLGQGSVTY